MAAGLAYSGKFIIANSWGTYWDGDRAGMGAGASALFRASDDHGGRLVLLCGLAWALTKTAEVKGAAR